MVARDDAGAFRRRRRARRPPPCRRPGAPRARDRPRRGHRGRDRAERLEPPAEADRALLVLPPRAWRTLVAILRDRRLAARRRLRPREEDVRRPRPVLLSDGGGSALGGPPAAR